MLAADLLAEQLRVNQAHFGEVRGELVHVSHSYINGWAPMVGSFHPEDFGKRRIDGHRAGRLQVCVNIDGWRLIENVKRPPRRILTNRCGSKARVCLPILNLRDNEISEGNAGAMTSLFQPCNSKPHSVAFVTDQFQQYCVQEHLLGRDVSE